MRIATSRCAIAAPAGRSDDSTAGFDPGADCDARPTPPATELRDFSCERRRRGGPGAVAPINLVTPIAHFGRWSTAPADIAHTLAAWAVRVPGAAAYRRGSRS